MSENTHGFVLLVSIDGELNYSWNTYFGNMRKFPVPIMNIFCIRLCPILYVFSSVQFSHSACLTLRDPMNCSMPSFPVHHQFLMSIESVMPSNQSSSVNSFSSCFQSFPASGSFLMSQLFSSGGQSIGISTSASVLPMNIQDWFFLGWTGWMSLLSKGLSRVFSNTTVQKHQFFGAQLSSQSNSHIHTWLLEKP